MGTIHRFANSGGAFDWEGVETTGYPAASNVKKRVLVGPSDGAASFAIRYFEVAPGGRSSLDLHEHDHGVVVLRGRGFVRLGEDCHTIAFGDVVYVEPNEVHQFEADADEPLGFLCVVRAR